MAELLNLLWSVMALPFKPTARLESQNLALRQQIDVLRRKVPRRLWLSHLLSRAGREVRSRHIADVHEPATIDQKAAISGHPAAD